MATRKQKMKVGAFLLMCVSLAASGAILISGLNTENGVRYWVEFDESVFGLYEGGMVQYMGVPVGKVENIRVTPNRRAHVDVVVNPDKVTLNDGVEAQLVLYSLATGTMCIQLSGGDPEAPVLKPGSEIKPKVSIITALSSRMEDIIENLSSIAESVSTGLAGIEEGDLTAIIEKVNRILDDAQTFVESGNDFVGEAKNTVTGLRGKAESAVDDFNALAKDVRKLAKNVDELVAGIKEKVGQVQVPELQGELNRVLENIASVSKQLEATLKHFDTMSTNALHEVDNVEYTVRTSLDEISEAFNNLRALLDQLQEDPSAVLRGKGRIKELFK
ncbi:MAG TPA: MlaD family protein [Candidatus Hydrogenedentes bacterium]|nr:MlaD family protein [Candidatus Hydrogenedentota bacterium]